MEICLYIGSLRQPTEKEVIEIGVPEYKEPTSARVKLRGVI